jgi:hypothetical protein
LDINELLVLNPVEVCNNVLGSLHYGEGDVDLYAQEAHRDPIKDSGKRSSRKLTGIL